jgi:hypothetical protein
MLNEDAQMVPAMHRQSGMQPEKSDTLGQTPGSYARRKEKMEIPRYVRAGRKCCPCPSLPPASPPSRRPCAPPKDRNAHALSKRAPDRKAVLE